MVTNQLSKFGYQEFQLAKQLFHGEGSKFLPFRIIQKAKEWIIAIRLERQYTKQEIIALYLNQVDFVNGAVGIRSAAKIYMNKEPKDLTLAESALFVGMLKNPALFNPTKEKRKETISFQSISHLVSMKTACHFAGIVKLLNKKLI